MSEASWICTTPERPWQQRSVEAAASGTPNLEWNGLEAQQWQGFGGCFNELGWIALQHLDESARRDVMQALFAVDAGCGFTLCRVPIGASDYAAEWYSCNETVDDFDMAEFSIARDRQHLLPYIHAAQALQPDLALFASPWSPPTWMKFPRAYNYGTFIMDDRYLDAYALYFRRFVEAYAAAGIPVTQVHVQNEPVADQKFPSCVWTGDELARFIGGHLGPHFAAHGLDTEIWLGTLNTDDFNGYPNMVLHDSQAAPYVAGVGLQWAGKHLAQRLHRTWPDLRLMQTENECGDGRNTWAYAAYVFDLIWHYLANGGEAYCYWNMVLREGGCSTWGWRQNSLFTVDIEAGTATVQPEYHVLRHVAGAVRPGARILPLSGPWSGNAVAARNTNGSVAVVVRNPFDDARKVTFRGTNATWCAAMPARSFNTFMWPSG